MIYPYTYFDHKIQKFHRGLTYFFTTMFELDLAEFDADEMLEDPMKEIVSSSKTRLEKPLKEIVIQYHALVNDEKEIIRDSFLNNNSIADLCKGEKEPRKYDQLPSTIKKTVEDFWKSIWEDFSSKESLNKAVKALCGEVLDHFHEFKRQPNQKTRVCPFCGLHGLKPSDDIHRNAYDHYLPKSMYPFNAVNFQNLVPICHECNSDEKKATDTLFDDDGNRREVFYPYDPEIDPDKLTVTISKNQTYTNGNSTLMKKELKYDYDILINGNQDGRVESWDSIFRLKERYHKYLADFETEWFEQLKSDFKDDLEDGIEFRRFKERVLKRVRREILVSEKGIIKSAYYNYLFDSDGFEEDLQLLISKKAA